MKIQTKLVILLLMLSFGVIAGSAIFTTISLDNYFRTRLINELTTQANQAEFIIRNLSEIDSVRYAHLQLYAHSGNFRLTLLDRAGAVLFESDLPREQLASVENHLQRPEVQQALREGIGTSTRHSATLNLEMLYLAKKIPEQLPQVTEFDPTAIVRVGVPLTQVSSVLDDIRSKIIAVSAVILIIVIGITIFVSKKLARPIKEMAEISQQIREGHLEKRIPVRSSDEFGKLAESLNGMVDKLNEDIAKLKKLELVRTEFLGNVSHELRTPIFAIQGMLETLLNGALEDKEVRKDFVERALDNTVRLNELLGDLIEISRIESGDMKMSFRYFTVREFLDQVVSEMSSLAEQKQISLSVLSDKQEMSVLGDKERLKQVMINLIDNAIKYTKQNGSVTISYQKKDDTVKISVIDTGVGMPEEHLPRIFERFYRVDKERSREAGGTGLGLAIVKHIVEAHDSSVDVHSEVNKGSTFSFTLKADRAAI